MQRNVRNCRREKQNKKKIALYNTPNNQRKPAVTKRERKPKTEIRSNHANWNQTQKIADQPDGDF